MPQFQILKIRSASPWDESFWQIAEELEPALQPLVNYRSLGPLRSWLFKRRIHKVLDLLYATDRFDDQLMSLSNPVFQTIAMPELVSILSKGPLDPTNQVVFLRQYLAETLFREVDYRAWLKTPEYKKLSRLDAMLAEQRFIESLELVAWSFEYDLSRAFGVDLEGFLAKQSETRKAAFQLKLKAHFVLLGTETTAIHKEQKQTQKLITTTT